MRFVGIDLAAERHVVAVVDEADTEASSRRHPSPKTATGGSEKAATDPKP
jgi:hypothetical protein